MIVEETHRSGVYTMVMPYISVEEFTLYSCNFSLAENIGTALLEQETCYKGRIRREQDPKRAVQSHVGGLISSSHTIMLATFVRLYLYRVQLMQKYRCNEL